MKTQKTENRKEAISIFNRKIGQLILRKREALGISQSQLAAIIGVNRTTISRIENGTNNELPAYYLPLISNACQFPARLYFEEEDVKQTLSVLAELLNWKAIDTYERAVRTQKSYESKIAKFVERAQKPFIRQEIVNVYLDGDTEVKERVGEAYNYGLVNNPSCESALIHEMEKYACNAIPFDFSDSGVETYPFTESDLNFVKNLSSLLETAKVVESLHGKKPLRRDLTDFIVDNFLLEAANDGHELSMRICAYLSQLYRTAWLNEKGNSTV